MSTPLHSQPGKQIYQANRHPRLNREQFASRWQQHSRIGSSIADPRLQSSVSSLRYCLTVDPTGILGCATDEHDGVALLALRSIVTIPALHAMLVGNEVAYADELRTFERPVEYTTMYAASELILDGAETDIVVLDLARRRPELGPVEFLRQAESQLGQECAILSTVGLRRWVRNVAIAPAGRGVAYDAVSEYWFDSLDQVRLAAPALGRHFDDTGAYTQRATSTTLVTAVIHKIGRDRP